MTMVSTIKVRVSELLGADSGGGLGFRGDWRRGPANYRRHFFITVVHCCRLTHCAVLVLLKTIYNLTACKQSPQKRTNQLL
jgi:hypothetical protein